MFKNYPYIDPDNNVLWLITWGLYETHQFFTPALDEKEGLKKAKLALQCYYKIPVELIELMPIKVERSYVEWPM